MQRKGEFTAVYRDKSLAGKGLTPQRDRAGLGDGHA